MSNNNDKNHACSNTENTVNARKRNVPEEEDYHGVVVRSSGNPRFSANASDHPLRSGIGHESRIVRVSRSSGGKDRHSKVLTAKGLRDRRVRLSVSTAIQFYDLQDRLGFDQPSKAVEWLIKAAANAIDELPPLDSPLFRTISNDPHIPNPHHPYTNNNVNIASNTNPQRGDSGRASGGINAFAESSSALGMSPTNDSQSSREGQEGQCEMIKPKARETLGKRKMSSNSTNSEEGGEEEEREGGGGGIKGMQETYYSALSLSRSESRVKAREHARKRAKGKSQIPATAAAASVVVRDSDGTRDSFTGLLNSVAQVALESRDIDENTRDGLEKRRTLCLSMNIMDHNPPNPDPHVPTPPPHIDHLFHDPPHQHILHSGSTMHQQSQSFPFSTFINAAIFSPLSLQRSEMTKPTSAFSTCQEQKHRPDHLFGNMGHFASNPSVQQQQQHHGSFLLSVDQETHEQQQFVPTISHDHMNLISFSMPGLSGRETLQSNSDNGMVYHMPSTHQRIQSAADQTQHNSMFDAMRNANNLHGGLDAQSLQSSIQDFDAQTSRSPALKGNKKHGNQNQYN